MSKADAHDRRAFLRGLVRWPALAGLGAMGAHLATRDGEPLQAGETCACRGVCRGCPVRARCGLPQGRLARAAEDARPGEPRF